MCSSNFRKGPALPKPGRLRPGTGTAWQMPSLDPMKGASDVTLAAFVAPAFIRVGSETEDWRLQDDSESRPIPNDLHKEHQNWTNDWRCARDVFVWKRRSCTVAAALALAFFPLKPSGFRSFSLILFRACGKSKEQSESLQLTKASEIAFKFTFGMLIPGRSVTAET